MAKQYDNSGSLFKNDRKENDKHPDYKGSCMIDGVEYWVSGWKKQSKTGDTFLGLAFQRKDQQARPQTTTTHNRNDDDF